MNFNLEPAEEVWKEGMPLVEAHCLEIGQKFPVLSKSFIDLDKMGKLRIFTARDDCKLVGYAIYIVDTNMMQSGEFVARDVGLYLIPEYRKSGNAASLMGYAEQSLKEYGITEIFQHIPAKSTRIGTMLERTGYVPIEVVYRKELTCLHQ